MGITISGNGIVEGNLANGAVTSAKLATNSVDSAELIDGAVDNSHLATGVDAGKLTTGTLPAGRYTDTVYTHPTTAGNKHIPSGGSTDQVLTYSSSGTASWAAPAAGGAVVQIERNDFKTAASTTTGFTARNVSKPNTSNAGAYIFGQTITPTSTSNILLIQVNITCMGSGDGKQLYCALFKDSDYDALSSSAAWIDSTDPQNMVLSHSMTAPSTSQIHFKVYCGGGNGYFYINRRHSSYGFHGSGTSGSGGSASSGITIFEYTP